MIGLRESVARIRSRVSGRRVDEALDDELQVHFDLLIEDYRRRGLPDDEARVAARRAFGNTAQIREAHRDERRLPLVDSVSQDMRYALRTLRRSPGFATAAIVTLALGIGATTAIFSLLDAVVVRSLPVQRPNELVSLSANYSYPSFLTLAEQSRPAIDLFATSGIEKLPVRLGAAEAAPTSVAFVSGQYFSVLGVRAAVGRTFMGDADREIGAPAVAVASDTYWQRRFARAPDLVGQVVHVSGSAVTVIGIAPPGFFGEHVGTIPDLWIPLTMRSSLVPGRDLLRSPGTSWLDLLGRLKPGHDADEVGRVLTVRYRQKLMEIFGPLPEPDVKRDIDGTAVALTSATNGLSSLRKQFARPLWILMAVVALVFLIACANVANLLLERATMRRREIGLRLALGISRGRLLRQLLAEAVTLSAIGASVGLLLAWGAREILLRLVSADGSRIPVVVTTDARMLAFVTAGSVVTALLFGLAPAWKCARADVATALGTLRGPDRRGRWNAAGSLLVIGQIGMSLTLLVGAGLFLRTLSNLRHVDLGFEPHHRLILDVDPRAAGYHGTPYGDLNRRLLQRLAAVPGVAVVTLSENGALMGRSGSTDRLRPPDWPAGLETVPKSYFDVVGPGYLAALGIDLIDGRDITTRDTVAAPGVVLINDVLSRQFFGRSSALGRHLQWNDLDLEVIGVTRSAKQRGPRSDARPEFYVPYFQHPDRFDLASTRFIVRASGDPQSVAGTLRSAIQVEDGKLPPPTISIATDLVDRTLVQERMIAKLSTAFGLLALALTCIGLYGLMAYRVAQRTNEIGIRMALGASRLRILWMVGRHEVGLVGAGLLLGVPLAITASRLTESLLFGVTTADPGTIVASVLVMTAIAVMASVIPARRATAIQPTRALRHE